jgi:hypothetical protein
MASATPANLPFKSWCSAVNCVSFTSSAVAPGSQIECAVTVDVANDDHDIVFNLHTYQSPQYGIVTFEPPTVTLFKNNTVSQTFQTKVASNYSHYNISVHAVGGGYDLWDQVTVTPNPIPSAEKGR